VRRALANTAVSANVTTATGLPPGITIASNGTISGSGSTLGTYTGYAAWAGGGPWLRRT
jgi:beta-glucosidase